MRPSGTIGSPRPTSAARTFAMAGPNSRTTAASSSTSWTTSSLDIDGFAPIGTVIEGMDVVDQIHSGIRRNRGSGWRRPDFAEYRRESNAYLEKLSEMDYMLRRRWSIRRAVSTAAGCPAQPSLNGAAAACQCAEPVSGSHPTPVVSLQLTDPR